MYATSQSGDGGTDGSSGAIATPATCSGWIPGTGQGAFIPYLNIFTRNVFTPGAGGKGNIYHPSGFNGLSGDWWPAGGGGGGVLLNGNGPNGQIGQAPYSNGFGGIGYGAGGGGGGEYCPGGGSAYVCYAGGRGADGIVYIEW